MAQYEKAIQTAFREVADALAGRATFGEQVRAQRAQTNALAITLSPRRPALPQTARPATSTCSTRSARSSSAQQALVQSRAAQLQNPVTLYRVLGGGWKDAPPS